MEASLLENQIIFVQRGDIVLVDFGEGFYSEQGGVRPALVIQNNTGNRFSPTTIVAPITAEIKNDIPTHYILYPTRQNGLSKRSTILFEQIRVIDKRRIIKKLGFIKITPKIEEKIKISIGLKKGV